MANKYLQLLQRHQIDIVKDLDVKYILDELFTKGAITSDEFYGIFNISQRSERAKFLMTTLMHKIQSGSPKSFEVFVDSLAKDYHWLWEKLSVENNDLVLNESFEDSLSKGDVPRLPKHYVGRLALEKEITAKLQLLTRHNVLVLHGMLGSGKTTIAISVLRHNPELINENFGGVVFWLDMKDCKTEDDIIAHQNNLFRKISLIVDTQNSIMTSSMSMSSVGSNADSHSLSMCDWTWRELRDKLKNQFTGHMIKDALLVLDEVSEVKCAEAFDVGCKMLITTRDAGVVSSFNAQIVNVSNSFNENETLQVFATFLDVDVIQLPPQVKQLHKICKGSPFHVGLIGSQLAESRERLIHDPKHWSYFINMFKKKDFLPFLPRHNDYNNPMKTIEVCVNSLKPNILILFKKLAIFPDSARVTVEVLSKLWNKSTFEAGDIAKSLSSKSLMTGSYEPEKRTYTYVIHDLIMNYLRNCLDREEIKRLHSEFLNRYGYGNLDEVSMDIIDDGYIAFNIGHHIYKTENLNNKWSLFAKLFLDLGFLGNKVRLTGPADVLLDLQKYENYIVSGDNQEKDLLITVKAFLSTYGTDLYRYPNTEIIQSILQHESKGVLYNRASEIANSSCKNNELVFEFLHEQNVEEVKHSTIDVKETITVVCFLVNYVLVGTSTGKVKCFHLATNTLKLEETISPTPIKWVGPCPLNPPLVAALSYDGIVKIWYFEDLEEDEEYTDVIDEEPENEYETPERNCSLTNLSGPFMNCRWLNYTESLLTHTQNQIQIYTSKGERQRVIDVTDKEILCCTSCSHDRYVIAACIAMSKETNINYNTVEVINIMTRENVAVFEESDTIMDLLSIRGSNKIITLKEKEIMQHEFKLSTYQNNVVCQSKQVLNTSRIRDCLTFLSMAVNKVGSYLFVSTNDSRVIGVDLKTNREIIYLENKRGNVISMSVSEILSYDDFTPGSDVLVTGTGDVEKCVKVWYLDPSIVTHKRENVHLTTDFDTSFLNITSPVTPNNPANNGAQSISNTPQRHNSFMHPKDVEIKSVVKGTKSLDRYPLKPLNLKGICNGNIEGGFQPFLAVVDDKNNIQIMRGRKILTEISSEPKENITIVRISPCNHYIFYGTSAGKVKKITLRTKAVSVILDMNSAVQYMEFVNSSLLIVSAKNRCMFGYKMVWEDYWLPEMMSAGNTNLGSQELLDTIGGVKMNGQSDKVSISAQDNLGSRYEKTGLTACFWINDIGLITVESNATIKLWGPDLKVMDILNPRQSDVIISKASFKKNVLAICDDRNRGFQTFKVITEDNRMQLHLIEDVKLFNCISSCDLTSDGNFLALGLDNGDVLVRNVRSQVQLPILKHHKTKVQYCSFSPVPEYRSNSTVHSPNYNTIQLPAVNEITDNSDDQPPLVLVTMASEVVWWNISYVLKTRANKLRTITGVRSTGLNVISPIVSPIPQDLPYIGNMTIRENSQFFFGDNFNSSKRFWCDIWRKKTHKVGAKRKEILACIKLSGISAKRLCHNEEFSCFTTVDNAGQIHIMNVMKQPCT